jgi:hypothetical protein
MMWAPLPPEVLNYLHDAEEREEALGWEAAVAKLNEFRALTDDYDGQGAKAPSSGTFDSIAELIRDLGRIGIRSPSWVVPGPNGSLNLDWEFKGGVSVSIEVAEPGEADVYLLFPGREPGYWVVSQTAAV